MSDSEDDVRALLASDEAALGLTLLCAQVVVLEAKGAAGKKKATAPRKKPATPRKKPATTPKKKPAATPKKKAKKKKDPWDDDTTASSSEASAYGGRADSDDDLDGEDAGPKQEVEQIYQKKTQLEHILLRPDTYGASVSLHCY